MSHPRITGELLVFGAALSMLFTTGCVNCGAKCEVCPRRETAKGPMFVALEDVAKMKEFPRGAVLTIPGDMWDKWSSKMERVDSDPGPGQVRFMMHRLPGDGDRLAMLPWCPDDAPDCLSPWRPLDEEFLSWARRMREGLQPSSPCSFRISLAPMAPLCVGACDAPTECQLVVQSTRDYGDPFGRIPVFGCACSN